MYSVQPVIKKILLLCTASFVGFICWEYVLSVPAEQLPIAVVADVSASDTSANLPLQKSKALQCRPEWIVSGIGLEKAPSLQDKALQQLIQKYRKIGYTDLQISFTIDQSGYLPDKIPADILAAKLAAPTVSVLYQSVDQALQLRLQQLSEQQGLAAVLAAYARADKEVFNDPRPDAKVLLTHVLLLPGGSENTDVLSQILQLQPKVDTELMQLALSLPGVSVDILQQLLQLYPLSAEHLSAAAFQQLEPKRFEQFMQAVLLREPQIKFSLDPLLEKLITAYPAAQQPEPADDLAFLALQQKLVLLMDLGFGVQHAAIAGKLPSYDRLPAELLSRLLENVTAGTTATDQKIIPKLANELQIIQQAKAQWPALEFTNISVCETKHTGLFLRLTDLEKTSSASATQLPAKLRPYPAIYAVLQDISQTTMPIDASAMTNQLLMQLNWDLLFESLLNGQSKLNEIFYQSTVWEMLLKQHQLQQNQPTNAQLLQLMSELHPSDFRAVYALATSKQADLVRQAIRQQLLSTRQLNLLACFLASQGLHVPDELHLSKEVQQLVQALQQANQTGAG